MCYRFTEQQRAEHVLERAQCAGHTPSAARTSARRTPSRLLLLETSTGLLVTITPWPFNPKCPQIQICGSVVQGILLDWWGSIATFSGANFMGGCRSSQRLIPIPPLSLSLSLSLSLTRHRPTSYPFSPFFYLPYLFNFSYLQLGANPKSLFSPWHRSLLT